MKEIKFRIWDEVYKEFRYWGFVDPDRDVFVGLPQNSRIDINYCRKHSEQFTGLLDKNGKEIYEGDLMFNPADDNCPQEVIWSKYNGCWCLGDEDFFPLNRYGIGEFWEVIGTIYDKEG